MKFQNGERFFLNTFFLVAFIFSGLGATNVRDFGAAGDGETDDYPAIMEAIESAEDGLLEFPAGKYRISESIHLVLEKHNISMIRGNGGSSSIWMTGEGPAILIEGSHKGSAFPETVSETTWNKEKMFTVESIEILGKHPAADGIELRGLMQPVVSNCLIREVRYGIHLTVRNRNVLLLGNHIYDCSQIGIYLDGVNIHQININDNHISYCKKSGIMIEGSEIRNIQIVGNDIEYNYDPENMLISADLFFDVSQKGSIREGSIASNTIQSLESKEGANILFIGHGSNNRQIGLLSITGNHISNQETLMKMKGVRGISVTGNTFILGMVRQIDVENGENIVVGDNVFDHNTDYFKGGRSALGGIRFSNSGNVIFKGNIIEKVAAGNTESGGALEVEGCSFVTVQSNHFVDSQYRGIEIVDSRNILVSHCQIYTTGQKMQEGILIDGVSENIKLDNNIIDSGIRGEITRD